MSRTMRHLRRITMSVVGALFTLQNLGCYSWASVPTPGPETAVKRNIEYRVRTVQKAELRFLGIWVRNDSLFGRTVRDTNVSVGIPLAQVGSIETHQFDATGTVVLAVGIVGAVVMAAAIAASDLGSGFGGSWGGWDTGSSGAFSCPLVYSWDGQGWHLDSGTFGGAITPALARTDLDNLIFARPDRGELRFLMTDEADETEHVDAFTVLAIDHPAGTDVAPDARANGAYHLLGAAVAPLTAHDRMGRDALAQVRALDDWSWESRVDGRDPENPADLRDGLELTFTRPAGADSALLVVDAQNTGWSASLMGEMVQAYGRLTAAWYDSTTTVAASRPMAQAQHAEGFLTVTIWDGNAWRPAGEIWEAGPEVAKRQVLPLDLSGIEGSTLRVRLESAPSFWTINAVTLADAASGRVTVRELPTTAVVAPRVADGAQRLATRDGRALDLERNDTIRITVRDTASRVASGEVRSYLARTSGWYRIHGRDHADPEMATLAALARGPHGAAREAITRMNARLSILNQEAARVTPR